MLEGISLSLYQATYGSQAPDETAFAVETLVLHHSICRHWGMCAPRSRVVELLEQVGKHSICRRRVGEGDNFCS